MPGTDVILGGMPEELSYISLSVNFPDLEMKPWEWEAVGIRWITMLQLWASVQGDVRTLHRQLYSG